MCFLAPSMAGFSSESRAPSERCSANFELAEALQAAGVLLARRAFSSPAFDRHCGMHCILPTNASARLLSHSRRISRVVRTNAQHSWPRSRRLPPRPSSPDGQLAPHTYISVGPIAVVGSALLRSYSMVNSVNVLNATLP